MINKLSILHLNIHSIITIEKQTQLKNLLSNYNPDLVSINETFLKPQLDLQIDGYTFYRHDRLIRRGGGTALGVKNSIIGKQINFDNTILNEYAAGFLVKTGQGEVAVISLYITPSNENLNNNLLDFLMKFNKLVIVGDLNAKSKLWYCPTDNKRGLELESAIMKHNLSILNNKKPTFLKSKSVIDLSICSKSMRKNFATFKVLPDKISDHQPTLTSFSISTTNHLFEINKIDYKCLVKKLGSFIDFQLPFDNESIDEAAVQLDKMWKLALVESSSNHTVSLPCNRVQEVPKPILDLIRAKRKARRKTYRNNSPENRSAFNILNRKVKTALQNYRQEIIEKKFHELKKFDQSCSKHWKIINSLNDKPTSVNAQSSFHVNNTVFTESSEIAEQFAFMLSNTFGKNTYLSNLPTVHHSHIPPDIKISRVDFETALASCNKNSACGNDGISNKLLAISPENIKIQILKIFQASLLKGHVPETWKIAKIIMIHKAGKPKKDLTSYRPISLLICLSKLLEKIINKKLTFWAESNNIFPPEQSGFRAKRSCQDHILRLTQQITDGFNTKQFTGAVFFDLEKAFDIAPHEGIIHKLEVNNLNPNLLNWIKSFLSERSYQVKWLKSTSNIFSINRGVPQGSCLSPTLFNIYFSDIANELNNTVNKGLFADDLVIWSTDSSLKAIELKLQRAINTIDTFCAKWGLILNKKKTLYTVFCPAGLRKNYYRTYNLNLRLGDTRLPLEPHPTFLGIKLDPKLDFKNHLELIETKIARKVNLFKRIKELNINQIKINSILFKSLIRSLFDYAFIPLASPTQKISGKLQILQNRILKQIKYFPPRTRTIEIHAFFKIPLIENRTEELLKKFAIAKRHHDLIASELNQFKTEILPRQRKLTTVFDKILRQSSLNPSLDQGEH